MTPHRSLPGAHCKEPLTSLGSFARRSNQYSAKLSLFSRSTNETWLHTGNGGEVCLAEVTIQEGESLENALRRFKRKVQQEDIIKEIKRHSYYVKPGEKRRAKEALSRKRLRKKQRRELGWCRSNSLEQVFQKRLGSIFGSRTPCRYSAQNSWNGTSRRTCANAAAARPESGRDPWVFPSSFEPVGKWDPPPAPRVTRPSQEIPICPRRLPPASPARCKGAANGIPR